MVEFNKGQSHFHRSGADGIERRDIESHRLRPTSHGAYMGRLALDLTQSQFGKQGGKFAIRYSIFVSLAKPGNFTIGPDMPPLSDADRADTVLQGR